MTVATTRLRQKGAPGFSPGRLAGALREARLDAADLRDAGLNSNLINKFLRNERTPSPKMLARVASALGVSGLDLMDPEDEADYSVRQRRFSAGMTTAEAGRTIGVSGVTYARLESSGCIQWKSGGLSRTS